jgi:PAS domain S-box-containing protein
MLRFVVEQATDGVSLVSPDGTILYVNQAMQTRLGYGDEIVGSSLLELYDHTPASITTLIDQAIQQAGWSDVLRHRRADGSAFEEQVSVYNVSDEQGETQALALFIRDVSETYHLVDELRASQDRLLHLLNSSPVVIFSCKASGNYDATFVSDNITTIFGHSAERFVNEVGFWANHIHPEDQPRIFAGLPVLFEQGTHVHEYRFRHDDGSYRWTQNHLRLISDEQGEPLEIVGSLQDITARKEAEIARRESEALLASTYDVTAVGLCVTDEQGRYVRVNQAYCDMYGWSAEELLGQHFAMVLPPESRGTLASQHDDFLAGGTQSTGEYVVQRKDGSSMHVWVSGARLLAEDGTRFKVTAVTDITERKRAEEALRESEARYRLLSENSRDMICLHAPDGTYRYISQAVHDLLGYEPEDLLGISPYTLFHPADIKRIEQESHERALRGDLENTVEYRIQRKDGSYIWLETRTRPIFDAQGEISELQTTSRDATARKQAQQALQESHQQLEQRVFERTAELTRINRTLEAEIVERRQVEAALKRSEALYRGMARHFPNGAVHLYDHNLRYLVSDGQIMEAIGLTRAGTEGKTLWEVLSPEACASLEPYYRGALAGEPANFEMAYQQRQFQVYIQPIYDEQRRIIAGLVMTQDITARKQAEEEIRRQAARAQALVRIAVRLNAQLDLDGVLATVCEEVRRALRVPVASMLLYDDTRDVLVYAYMAGLSPHVINRFRPVPRAFVDEQTAAMGSVRTISDLRAQPDHPNAEAIRIAGLRTTAHANIMRSGQLVGIVEAMTLNEVREFTRDERLLLQGIASQAAQALTNARLFEEVQQERGMLARRVEERTAELSIVNAQLQRALRAKDIFLANMSHELRTPLNAILGLSEALQEGVYGQLADKQISTLRSIEESGRHLLTLINDILDLAKIEAGQEQLELDSVRIDTICQASMRMIKQQAHKKRLAVSLQLDAQVTTLQADERRLKQMLVNLLSNAVKFTPERGEIGLEVSSDAEQQTISFAIWDTGIGIAPADQERLFQAFVQIESSLNKHHEGTGLGLALVARLADLHGGSVAIESAEGQGSRFTVVLPWISDEPAAALPNPGEAQRGNGPEAPDALPTPPDEQRHILLVEDNEVTIGLLSDYIALKGYRISVARNGYEALDRVYRDPPDLILMDIQMPGMDGLEAIRRIRNDTLLSGLPIVALTALAMQGDRERCLEAGANDYLSKPISLKQLQQMIETHLQKVSSGDAGNRAQAAVGAPR